MAVAKSGEGRVKPLAADQAGLRILPREHVHADRLAVAQHESRPRRHDTPRLAIRMLSTEFQGTRKV
jgi:hypothetical protein